MDFKGASFSDKPMHLYMLSGIFAYGPQPGLFSSSNVCFMVSDVFLVSFLGHCTDWMMTRSMTRSSIFGCMVQRQEFVADRQDKSFLECRACESGRFSEKFKDRARWWWREPWLEPFV